MAKCLETHYLLQFLLHLSFTAALLDDALHNYETLHHDSFKHHIKRRDLYAREPQERHLEFDTFGRHFNLILHRSSSVLADDFKVVSVDEHNNEEVVDFRPTIYHGYVADEPNTSLVNAYWEDENTVVASIRTTSDVYAIEPSWRHLPNSTEYSMISYRGSDLKVEDGLGKHFCGYIRPGEYFNQTETMDSNSGADHVDHLEGLRFKRSTSCTKSYKNPVCGLILVADYRFYSQIGGNNKLTTTSYLIGVIDKINNIYTGTSFDKCGTGYGFQVKEIKIYPTASTDDGTNNFNIEKKNWETNDLLESFSRDSHFKDFCLSHLFTATQFTNGVLGLAYIGGSRPYSLGGVCSPSYVKGDNRLYLNTGWSSALSSSGDALLTLQYVLVTAHGHNWGSEHDPDSTECAPSSSSGGRFIMYAYSVSGMNANNKFFSPCSQRSMGAVLAAKESICFSERSSGLCGNSRVEAGEDCDPGLNANDPCCDTSCRFRSGKLCSDSNDLCCTNCQFASAGKVCQDQQSTTCQSQSVCSGLSKSCPVPRPLLDESPCNSQNTGFCRNGTCLSLCEYNGKYSCVCDSAGDACKWCCRDTPNGNCTVHKEGRLLPKGTPCYQGSCDEIGQCKKLIVNNIARLWGIIEHVSVNQLVMFMRANIVGTIIVLSLIIWIPVCSMISYNDYKKKKENKHKKFRSVEPVTIKRSQVYVHSRKSLDQEPLLA